MAGAGRGGWDPDETGARRWRQLEGRGGRHGGGEDMLDLGDFPVDQGVPQVSPAIVGSAFPCSDENSAGRVGGIACANDRSRTRAKNVQHSWSETMIAHDW